MATRIKEPVASYKEGTGIQITNNHIISVLLREANNLIQVNENNELYVDLQLPAGIKPTDDFPVGVTTGKILQEDGWQQSGLILNWKTTSGDYNRLIYANDGHIYIDYGDGVWHPLGEGGGTDLDCNTRTFYLPLSVTNTGGDYTELQKAINWYYSGKDPILWYNDGMYVFDKDMTRGTDPYISFIGTDIMKVSWESDGTAHIGRKFIRVYLDPDTHEVTKVKWESEVQDRGASYLPTNITLRNWFYPTELNHPVSLGYLNQELEKKQDVLTAGTRISITVDPDTGETIISADVSGAMTYKGNVTDPTQLPSTGNTQGDCWYSESDGHLYAWDGTQWKDVGGSGITYTPGDGISISSNNVISNDAPFEPTNSGSAGDVLKKTQNGYEWGTDNDTTYSEGTGIHIDDNNVISSTGVLTINNNTPDNNGNIDVDEFSPDNTGTTGQVLKKTANGYEWSNESGGGTSYTPGNGINIDSNNEISNTGVLTVNGNGPDSNGNVDVRELPSGGSAGQVLKRTNNGYTWANESGGGGSGTTYYDGDYISIDSSDRINNTAPFVPGTGTAGQVLRKTQDGYEWSDDNGVPSGGTQGQVLTKTEDGYEWQTPSTGESTNVMAWSIDMGTGVRGEVLKEIVYWLMADNDNGAILKDADSKDTYIYLSKESTGSTAKFKFLGTKANSTKTSNQHGDFTHGWQNVLTINVHTDSDQFVYGIVKSENTDDDTIRNYLSVEGAGYTNPYIPTQPWQPVTKYYVDSVASGSISVPAITNNQAGTTSTLTQIWKGTQAEYDALGSYSNTILYIIV